MRLVLTAHRSQSALKIRERFRRNQINFDEAMHEIEGFFTTLKPRRNLARWSRWLSRTYKKRWFEETGFRMLNAIHESFRNRYPSTQLAQIYLRAYVFTESNRLIIALKSGKLLNVYQSTLKRIIERKMFENIRENVWFLQKEKRGLYFMSKFITLKTVMKKKML